MIRNLRALNKTVFLTTHYLDEAEQLADRVAIIAQGEIVASGTPSELTRTQQKATIRFRTDQKLDDLNLAEIQRSDDGWVTLEVSAPTETLYQLTRWASERGTELEGLTVTRASLEDVYLQLVAGRSETESGTE